MDQTAFVDLLGGVFEHSPWVAREAWQARPFSSTDDLHRAMTGVVEAADRDKQLALLCSHPELSGKEADAGALTSYSEDEQSGVGLNALSSEEAARIRRLNAEYREKFGFPFIIAVRNHTKGSIFNELEQRLGNEPETELTNDLKQVFAITRLRLEDIVPDRGGFAEPAADTG
ncbi:MAG: 2-oxo-4-hydroxy-4-carboxy-5-ureidoimidazoline decarboxylase [Alphaproteobacteria bacterium]|nr:2-oxo-4-hydroxy-4-carboxy-5-ureidoimidazoline decarboxylase [Alphaproteobacteria bacterium]